MTREEHYLHVCTFAAAGVRAPALRAARSHAERSRSTIPHPLARELPLHKGAFMRAEANRSVFGAMKTTTQTAAPKSGLNGGLPCVKGAVAVGD